MSGHFGVIVQLFVVKELSSELDNVPTTLIIEVGLLVSV
jgi:hypothetical protein